MSVTKICSLFLGISFLVSGCATTYNKEICAKIDWNKSGYEDAMKGAKLNRAAIKGCSEHVDYEKTATAYTEGYASGLEKFCTKERGQYWGSLGNRYQDTCPLVLEKNFLSGYLIGNQQYEAAEIERKRIEGLNRIGGRCVTNPDCSALGTCEAFVCQPR